VVKREPELTGARVVGTIHFYSSFKSKDMEQVCNFIVDTQLMVVVVCCICFLAVGIAKVIEYIDNR
jgi:hypothetical protein